MDTETPPKGLVISTYCTEGRDGADANHLPRRLAACPGALILASGYADVHLNASLTCRASTVHAAPFQRDILTPDRAPAIRVLSFHASGK
jgi:hypothetical protein